jgi:hypothetical protein
MPQYAVLNSRNVMRPDARRGAQVRLHLPIHPVGAAIVRLQHGVYKLLVRDISVESLSAALAWRQRIRAGDDIDG